MFPTYLSDSGVFENTERIDWLTLKVYKEKLGLQTSEISHNPFDVEYVQNILQQAFDSLVTKAKKDYTSDNDDPPRPKNTFLQSPDESAIVTLE
ncbi:hypothetical protein BC332_07366 [Capsicum chinense]|nr:hypothetical protein BC332_07366 [Capsicum chinense]